MGRIIRLTLDESYEAHPSTVPSFQRGPDIAPLGDGTSLRRSPVPWRDETFTFPKQNTQNASVTDGAENLHEYGKNHQFGHRYGAPISKGSSGSRDNALPSIEIPHSPQIRAKRLEGESLQMDRRMMPDEASIQVTQRYRSYGEIYEANGDPNRVDPESQTSKRRRLGYDGGARNVYDYGSHLDAQELTAPTIHKEVYHGPRHVPLGASPGHNNHMMRRNHVIPDDRTYLAPRQLEKTQEPTYTHYGSNAGLSKKRKFTDDLENHAVLRYQPERPIPRRSPRPALPQTSSNVGYRVLGDETSIKKDNIPRPFNTRPRGGRSFNADHPKPSTATNTGSRFPLWRRKLYEAAERQPYDDSYSSSIYLPVDSQAPGFRHWPQDPNVQVRHVEQPYLGPSAIGTRSYGRGNELSYDVAPVASHSWPHWDMREVRPARDYAHYPYDTAYEGSDRLHDLGLARYNRERESGLQDYERYGYNQDIR